MAMSIYPWSEYIWKEQITKESLSIALLVGNISESHPGYHS